MIINLIKIEDSFIYFHHADFLEKAQNILGQHYKLCN